MVDIDLTHLFLSLTAIGVLLIGVLPLINHLRTARKGAQYKRSATYRVWPNQREFKILGLTSLMEVETLIDHLTQRYTLDLMEHDPEPDESFWILESDLGTVKLCYDDHEGARIRTIRKKKRGLFEWLQRDIPQRRWIRTL